MMLMTKPVETSLIDRLPPVRGRYRENAPLATITWFRVGGPAEVMFRPADRDDLVAFLGAKPGEVPVTVIGVGSNLLVRDGGVRGVVLRLGPAAQARAEEDPIRRNRAVTIGETEVLAAQAMHPAARIQRLGLDQDALQLLAVGAGVHA